MSLLALAIHRTFHNWPGGLPAAAAALGKNEQVLRNKASPTVMTNVLSVHEARDAMLMSGDLQILQALADELGVRVLPAADAPSSVLVELMAAEAEHGDVARALSDALRDGRITPREAADVAAEINEEIAAKQRLLVAVQRAAQGNVDVLKG